MEERKPNTTRISGRTIEKNCFKCSKIIEVKWVRSKKNYSQKNNWEYWTENKENEGKYICNNCLRLLYYRDSVNFNKEVSNPKKMNIFRTYLSSKGCFD